MAEYPWRGRNYKNGICAASGNWFCQVEGCADPARVWIKVLVGDMERTRLKEIKALFFVGVTSEIFRKIQTPAEF